jgi:hypothetical protein
MKKILLVLALVIAGVSVRSYAQAPYSTALGVRLGDPDGITLQHYLSGSSAVEGILGIGSYWFTITGLYEFHQQLKSTPGLGWYIGFGAHLGSFTTSEYYHDKIGYTGFLFGLDGILGLDYTFQHVPLNLSLDWKPAIELSPFNGFIPGEFGLSVRYTFGRNF